MILTNRLFTRREPELDAKSVYIFCEGKKREYQYFQYFKGIDSKINVVVYPLQDNEDNSPTGLYKIATYCLVKSESNPSPAYELIDGDVVWFVIDTDKWEGKVVELRALCADHHDWQIAQSNPCFEVWLYHHLFAEKASFNWMEQCVEWKGFLGQKIPGGFDSKRHPIYLKDAIENASNNFSETDGQPDVSTTQVFQLGEVIYAVCKWKIDHILNRI
jgi:hypothetical protein